MSATVDLAVTPIEMVRDVLDHEPENHTAERLKSAVRHVERALDLDDD